MCQCVGFGHVMCLISWTARCSPSARDEPQSLHGLNQGRASWATYNVCAVLHTCDQPCRVRHVARSTPGSGVWERATASVGGKHCCLTPPPPVHTPVCPLLLLLGTVNPCVQCWAARRHPPPALGEHPRWSWRVLTLLWGGGRGAVRAGGGSCAAWWCRVCVQEGASASHRKTSGDGPRVCPHPTS